MYTQAHTGFVHRPSVSHGRIQSYFHEGVRYESCFRPKGIQPCPEKHM